MTDLLSLLIQFRRGVRRITASLEQLHNVARQHRRQVRKLKERALPFDSARIVSLEALAKEATEACTPLRTQLKQCSYFLVDIAGSLDSRTTLSQRCEILNVNVADRGDLTEADGIREIVFLHGLEDSAANRRAEWKNGPLFQAFQRMFVDFLLHTEEGRAVSDSLFESGGMFEAVPMYKRAADGTMVRQPPRLRSVPAGPGAPTSSIAADGKAVFIDQGAP